MINCSHVLATSIDYLEYCVMFVCNFLGIYSMLTNSIGSCPPPPTPKRPTHSKKYHKYITNIPQIYHKSTTKM